MQLFKKNIWFFMILPGVLFLAVFMLIPLCSLLLTTVFPDQGDFSMSAYATVLQSTYFQQVFLRSLKLSILSTILCALLGYPAAYYIAKFAKNKGMLMAFAVFPMFTSPVIRSFSWMVILGKKGIVNKFLVAIGLFAKPQSLLYNEFSITIGFIQLFLPLMILSLIGGGPDARRRKPRLHEARQLPARHPAAERIRSRHRLRARVHRLHHRVHHAAASRWHRHPRALDHDLSVCDESR